MIYLRYDIRLSAYCGRILYHIALETQYIIPQQRYIISHKRYIIFKIPGHQPFEDKPLKHPKESCDSSGTPNALWLKTAHCAVFLTRRAPHVHQKIDPSSRIDFLCILRTSEQNIHHAPAGCTSCRRLRWYNCNHLSSFAKHDVSPSVTLCTCLRQALCIRYANIMYLALRDIIYPSGIMYRLSPT